jgi:hypothetical protein
MLGISMFQYSKGWKLKQNYEYQYYLNYIDTYTIWEISGQAITIVLLCLLAKYIIYLTIRMRGGKKELPVLKKSSTFIPEGEEEQEVH